MTSNPKARHSTAAPAATAAARVLHEIVARNRAGSRVGTYAVCSAHPAVIDAAVHQALDDGGILHVESTSSQVNQFGGYTATTPQQFADGIRSVATQAGLPPERVLIGADHLGPYCWRGEPSDVAMAKACELARLCIRAGYQKIHLDASMACADDGDRLEENVVAERAALLCEAAERECERLQCAERPFYVIGTEVPPPGGEVAEGECPRTTDVDDVQRSLTEFSNAFDSRRLCDAWNRVVALVVQPGVEFGNSQVFDYGRSKARSLSRALPSEPALVYEAHSTDYQTQENLAQMVEDHFGILKVGPWLTFAYREAVFALAAIERELLGDKRAVRVSQVREALDAEMLRDPGYWRPYYQGDDDELRLARTYSFSDRCRYYWPRPVVQKEIDVLLKNLGEHVPPLTLLSQFLPLQYEAIRDGIISNAPRFIVRHKIQRVLRGYAVACGMRTD